jgi:hypothetical protein
MQTADFKARGTFSCRGPYTFNEVSHRFEDTVDNHEKEILRKIASGGKSRDF